MDPLTGSMRSPWAIPALPGQNSLFYQSDTEFSKLMLHFVRGFYAADCDVRGVPEQAASAHRRQQGDWESGPSVREHAWQR